MLRPSSGLDSTKILLSHRKIPWKVPWCLVKQWFAFWLGEKWLKRWMCFSFWLLPLLNSSFCNKRRHWFPSYCHKNWLTNEKIQRLYGFRLSFCWIFQVNVAELFPLHRNWMAFKQMVCYAERSNFKSFHFVFLIDNWWLFCRDWKNMMMPLLFIVRWLFECCSRSSIFLEIWTFLPLWKPHEHHGRVFHCL